ncbi:endonuclease/exonuclease/phosphatase family protein [Neobacillus sp. Marseille-QA0830]
MTEPTGVAEDNIHLKIMTLNTAVGGQNSSPQAVAEAMKATGADIIGIQEPFGSAEIFKQITGFYYSDRLAVLSRYPIIDNGQRDYVYVEVQPGKVVAISNVHLPAGPYWPDQLRDGNVTPETAVAGENNSRMKNLESRFETLPALVARDVPVFFTGDFNNPSDLDWIDSVKDLHLGYAAQWPVSQKLRSLGFHDSYRDIYPDPKTKPAFTYTPGTPIGTIPPGTMLDRIDFIYAGGAARTLDSKIVGETGPYTDLAMDPWVSDHRGVLSEFEVTPAPKSVLEQDPAPVHATLTPDKKTYRQGETIKIDYTESTRQFDIVAVYPEDQAPTTPAKVFKYTALDSQTLAGPIKPNGQVTFNSAALQSGTYKAYLLANRGYGSLAETTFTVEKGPTITLNKTKTVPGNPVTAAFTGSSSPTDWIGIFKQQETGRSVGDDFNSSDTESDFSIQGAVKQDGTLHAATRSFGVQPDGQYDNFAITFDVANYTSWGGWLGFAFGMPKKDSNYYDVGSNLFFFQGDQNARVIKYDKPGGTALGFKAMGSTYQLNTKPETLNVKLVLDDGKLDAYWKLQSEPASALAKPKASWTGLNYHLGYMKLVVDGIPNVSLDNIMVYKDPNHLQLDPKIEDGINAPLHIVIGQPYTLEYGGSTSKTDWVALTDTNGTYLQGDAPHWNYLSNNARTVPAELKKSGIVTFTAEQTAQLSPGPMQVRFYPNNGTGAAKIIDVVAEELDRTKMPWKYVSSNSQTPGQTPVELGSVTFSETETAGLEPGGVYTVRLMSSDSNTEMLDSKMLTIQKPPAAPTVTVKPSGWTNEEVAFSITPGDDPGISKTQYRLNGGEWQEVSGSLPTINTEGITTIEARSIDADGNISKLGTAVAKIDRTAPSLSLSGLSDGDKVLMGSRVPVSWIAADSGAGLKNDGSGSVMADTQTPGQHTVSISVSDLAGNTTTKTLTYTVYKFSGFMPPLKENDSIKQGAAIPVKFKLTDGTQSTGEAAATLQVDSMDGHAAGNSSVGNTFTYDTDAGEYHFNLKTTELSKGAHTITVAIKLGPSEIKKSLTLYVK